MKPKTIGSVDIWNYISVKSSGKVNNNLDELINKTNKLSKKIIYVNKPNFSKKSLKEFKRPA